MPESEGETPKSPDSTLASMGKEIEAAQAKLAPKASQEKDYSGIAVGYRMSAEFVAAIAVGAVLGYGIDWLVHTTPFGLVLGLGFGFAAGIVTLLRSARRWNERTAAAARADKD